jgi:uncharacterized protein (DUF1015 family)
MATIRAFVGYRPPQDKVARVASPPYDVINSEEARQMALGNPISFLHINKPEIDLDPSIDLYSNVVYATARKNLERFIAEGTLTPDPAPYLYAYQQTMNGHTQLGLMAAAAVDDYDADRIKKHEKTRKDKEDDRTRHVHETGCNAGPVFLTYRADSRMDGLMKKASSGTPDVDFVADDGIRHVLWVIRDKALIEQLVITFKAVDPTYVADGHHRAKSGSRVREMRRSANPNHTGDEAYNYFMAVFFPHDQLKILDYNRVVKDLNGLSVEQFMNKVGEKFAIEPATEAKPARVHDFGMYLDGKWYRLTAKAGTFDADDPVGCLDVSIMQQNLLAPILGIADPRTDKRVDFIGGIRGMKELEKRVNGGWQVAFAMYPTTMEQLMDIADAGEIMPPKSTWFEPKLRSGLVIHRLD